MVNVIIYGTSSCPYCIRAEQLLRQKGIADITKIAIDHDVTERDKMITITGRRTVPQIFINDAYVGGFDELVAIERTGQLNNLLAE